MKFRSKAWLLVGLLACQTQNRPKPTHALDESPDRGQGPIVEPAPDPSPQPKPAPTPGPGPSTPDKPDPAPDTNSPKPTDLPTTPIEAELGPLPVEANPNLPFGLPTQFRSGKQILISRPEYVLSWNRETRNADWAAYKLVSDDLGETERTDFWTPDPDLETYLTESGEQAVQHGDYSGSCLDRGHQVPSADRTKNEESNQATFVMSNANPQTAFLNQNIWNRHEQKIRGLLETEDCLWIITGPIYGTSKDFIGKQADIAVPESSFKAVFGCDAPPKLHTAVIMPNVNGDGASRAMDRDNCRLTNGKMSKEPEDYETDVETIETKAKIKLLSVP